MSEDYKRLSARLLISKAMESENAFDELEKLLVKAYEDGFKHGRKSVFEDIEKIEH